MMLTKTHNELLNYLEALERCTKENFISFENFRQIKRNYDQLKQSGIQKEFLTRFENILLEAQFNDDLSRENEEYHLTVVQEIHTKRDLEKSQNL